MLKRQACAKFQSQIFDENEVIQILKVVHWHFCQVYIQVNLIITLSLVSIETDRVISEPCYNEVIYYRHIAK